MPPRRTHTKSRSGCVNCKRRKVKCDETYPTCFHCKRHGVPCSLSATTHDASRGETSASTPTQPNILPPTPCSGAGDAASCPTGDAVVTASDQIAPFPPQELLSKDFELLHHYCTVTADTMSIRKEMSHVWRVCIPREGYQHPFVMHGVLAVSAVHKAYLMPNKRNIYLALSDYHSTLGSEGFRSALQDIRPETAMALFSFASVIVLYMFTLPSRSHDGHLEDPIHSMLELVCLIRGMKTTLQPLMRDILRSEFAPLVYGVWPFEKIGVPNQLPSVEHTLLPLDTWDAFKNLQEFLEQEVPSSSLEHYNNTIEKLRESAKLIALAGVYVESGAVVAWMYGIDDSIILDIESCRPHAMLILAYQAVFLATTERNFWFNRGWTKALIDAVEAKLAGQPKFLSMLQWPKKSLEELHRWI